MFRLKLFKVQGRSMAPEYLPNDVLICAKWPFIQLRPGHNLVINHPYYHTIVKKVTNVLSSGDVIVSGTSPDSTPSAAIGVVQKHWIEGRVVMHMPYKQNPKKGAVN